MLLRIFLYGNEEVKVIIQNEHRSKKVSHFRPVLVFIYFVLFYPE